VTGSPALRDLLRCLSDEQRVVFAIGGMLAAGKSDPEIAKAVGVELALVHRFRALVVQRAGRPEVLAALLPDRVTKPHGPSPAPRPRVVA
jgi:hypothetical protein